MEFLSEADCDPDLIRSQTVAVIGYGNQGHAHAQNLRDQGVPVVVGQRPGPGWNRAVADGFAPLRIEQAARAASVVMLTLPDEFLVETFRWHVAPSLEPGDTVLLCHGFAATYGGLTVPEGVSLGLVGPKGAGRWLRSEFQQGRGLFGLIAVDQDATGNAWETVKSYAWGIGCARVGLMRTTLKEETDTDLFGEQVVLCGGLPALVRAAYETLVEAGYSPEAAYLECVHEVKLIADLMYSEGLAGMRKRISDTAEWGGQTIGTRIVGESTRREMKAVLAEIQSGSFAESWAAETRAGKPSLAAGRERDSSAAIEQVGQALRRAMDID